MTEFVPPHPFVVDPQTCERLCRCQNTHPRPDTRRYIGADGATVLATDRQRAEYMSVLVLDDQNTHRVVGQQIVAALNQNGPTAAVQTMATPLAATQQMVDKIVERARECDLIIAVGAGTINDLAKAAAGTLEIPYWVVPTAPSMNGYTSGIAALKIAGVKRTLPAAPPACIYAIPDIIAQAPANLVQAGYCDIMAKSVSDIDWQIESRLFSDSYCPMPSDLVGRVEGVYLTHPQKIRHRDPQTVMGLFEGLLISGVAMRVAGSSAPASGGEHLVSHVWDMRESMTGRVPELHGLQVAAGIIVSACCYRHLAALTREAIPISANQTLADETRRIASVWGPLADEVQRQFDKKQPALKTLNQLLRQHWPEIHELCRQIRPAEHYQALMHESGFDLSLKSLNLSASEFLLAATTARTIRDRITVLDLAAQTGVLQAACADALKGLS